MTDLHDARLRDRDCARLDALPFILDAAPADVRDEVTAWRRRQLAALRCPPAPFVDLRGL